MYYREINERTFGQVCVTALDTLNRLLGLIVLDDVVLMPAFSDWANILFQSMMPLPTSVKSTVSPKSCEPPLLTLGIFFMSFTYDQREAPGIP